MTPGSRLEFLLRHRLIASAALLALLGVVYWDGFWGPPRHDQLVYLYEASRFPRFLDRLAYSPAWNRVVSVPGDQILYRPVLYLLLASEHALFGMNFFLWQAAGIGLHAAQTLLLHRMFLQRAPQRPGLALLAAALFGTLLLSSEAVIWHHITGYVLFTLCATGSVACLLRHLDTGRERPADWSLLLMLVAVFTYEFGVLLCPLMAIAIVTHRRSSAAPAAALVMGRRARAVAFLGLPVLYATVSFADLTLRGERLGLGEVRIGDVDVAVWRLLSDTTHQIVFWLGGLLLPALYGLHWSDRTIFYGFRWSGGPFMLANVLAAYAAVGAGLALAILRWRVLARQVWPVSLGAASLAVYSLMIALGRSGPRGLDYTLTINLYYSYVAFACVFVTMALVARRPPVGERGEVAGPAWLCRAVATVGFGALIVFNASETMKLLAQYRYDYAAPHLEVLYHVGRWHTQRAPGTYFRLSHACPASKDLPWFVVYRYRSPEMPEFHFIDALYPDTSWNVQRATAPPGSRVVDLSCAERPASLEDVMGRWWAGSQWVTIDRSTNGWLRIRSTTGVEFRAILDGRQVLAPAWRNRGLLSRDGRYIFWSNETTWRR